MIEKLTALRPVRKLADLAVGFWETFLRDNRVIPPVLAVAALFVFTWLVVGSFIGTPGDEEPVANQDEVAQSEGGGSTPPEIENPNTDSYAAYNSKDPFRQLFETAESTTQQEDPTEDTTPSDDTGGDGFQDDGTDTGDDGSSDDFNNGSDDGTSTGNPGAADGQYDNGRTPRPDPTDNGGSNDTDDTSDTDSNDAGTRTPPPNRDAGSGGDLFDSGGDLQDPNRR